MTKTLCMNGAALEYDDSLLDGGTLVDSYPRDLNDLWELAAVQAGVFVAEAIINDNPFICMDFCDGKETVTAYIWTNNDTPLSITCSLADLIEHACIDGCRSDEIESDEDAKNARTYIARMRELMALVDKRITFLESNELAEWERGIEAAK